MSYIVGPAITASIGFMIGGPLGAAIGWTVGAWLFAPSAAEDNEIFDPGAEELPSPNQALRGTTMPVIFGTVRINSNIVWTKNFTTVRNETTTGSGGKSGGSGGPSKSGSSPAQISYEYKWDMMFHIGMSPLPVTIFGGWVGANRISSNTIQAILSGSGNYAFVVPDQNAKDDVDFTFDDAYFGRAYPTGADEPAWDGFEVAEGHSARWPHTAYVIFDQLNLGSSPRVPQFSWEVGPGEGSFNFNSEFRSTALVGVDMTYVQGIMQLDSGVFLIATVDSGGDTRVFVNADNGDEYSITKSRLRDDLVAGGLITLAEISAETDLVTFPVEHNKYFYATFNFQVAAMGTTSKYVGILYEITNTGTFIAHKGFRIDTIIIRAPVTQDYLLMFGLMDDQALSDEMLILAMTPGTRGVYLYRLPSPARLLESTNFVNNSSQALQNTYGLDLASYFEGSLTTYFEHGSRSYYKQFGAIVGKARIGSTSVLWDTDIFIVRTRLEINQPPVGTLSSWAATNDPLYPNGYITRVRVSKSISGGLTLDSVEIVNDLFVDQANPLLVYPFEDDDEDRDGTIPAASDLTGYVGFTKQRLPESVASYTWLILFPKVFATTPASNVSVTGNYTTVRAFLYDPFAGKATASGIQSGSYFSASTDLGVTVNTPGNLLPYFDTATGTVFLSGHYNSLTNARVVVGAFGSIDISGETDLYPPYIIKEILTNSVFGANINLSVIDSQSYSDALAYCTANNIQVSVIYNREESVLDIVAQLLALYGGFLVVTGGKIKFGIQDVSNAPVRIIDNNRMLVTGEEPPVTIISAARQDSYNKIRVNYFDRSLSYRQNQVEVSDEVDMDLNGVRVKEFPPKFVMSEALAGTIATKALWSNLYAREAYEFSLGLKDSDLEPGDVLTLVDSFHPELSGGVRVRIGRIAQKEPGQLRVVAVRELDYVFTSSFTALSVSSPTSRGIYVGGVGPPIDFRAYELPYELQLGGAQVLFGYNPSERTAGARLYLSPDNTTFAQAGDIQPFIVSGIFNSALPYRSTGYVENNVEIFLSPTSGFSSASPTYVQTYNIDNVDAVGRGNGLGTLIAGSEALAMEGLTLIGQNHYRVAQLYRGWGGTPIQDHSSGSYWHRNGGGVLGANINEDQVGTTFYYKVVPYNFNGQAYNVASIPSKSWQVKGTPFLPQPIGNLDVYANSATNGQSIPIPSSMYRNVNVGGSPITVNWRPSSRTTGFGAGGFGAGAYGRFTRDVATPDYFVSILSGNTVVRSVLVNTEVFVYSVDTNSTDFNGWSGQFQLQIRERNAYGDAPYTTIHSVNLF